MCWELLFEQFAQERLVLGKDRLKYRLFFLICCQVEDAKLLISVHQEYLPVYQDMDEEPEISAQNCGNESSTMAEKKLSN